MTDEQKYSEVLKELGELLHSKNVTISCQKTIIRSLEKQLKEAEAELQNAKSEVVAIRAAQGLVKGA